MRSSTSRCLIAALTRRITPRLALSPPFMAAFMSSVRRCLRLIGGFSGSWNTKSRRRSRVPASRDDLDRGAGRRQAGSVHALALGDVARGAAGLALHRRGGLALALLRRLLVVLALAGLLGPQAFDYSNGTGSVSCSSSVLPSRVILTVAA